MKQLAVLLLVFFSAIPAAAADQQRDFRVLVFSKTAGFRHASIPDGIRALKEIGTDNRFILDATEDATDFNDDNLSRYDVVIFLSTTGDVLNTEQEQAFKTFIKNGGGYVGIHAAADTEYDWAWYGRLVGAYFRSHPRIQEATVRVADRHHPATAHLDFNWTRTDEWYDYRSSPRGDVHVLATLDERTYEGGIMGHDHPIVWCHEFDGGRAFYTGGGHTSESFEEPDFRAHLLGGIQWAAGVAEGESDANIWENYDKVVLVERTSDPMELAVANDGRVIFVERGGAIRIYDPEAHNVTTAGYINVFDGLEDGLLGITLDPEFDETGWLYVYYSPAGDEPKQHLSRLTMVDGTIDPDSEIVILEVPTQRDECCHSGGSLTFGPDGLLYISTGDNTNPFASDGYAAIDERIGRSPWDAQKSSANPNDLRGKILRILPLSDGTYDIPRGNLFDDDSQGRPEIYVMGCRNPFRISVDSETGYVYWGDVGPDASAPRDGRGPAGHDEFNQARGPGFFGWPLFIGNNLPYHQYDFATGESGAKFDIDNPINDSPNNTGPRDLPPAQPAWISYTYDTTPAFPELGAGGRCAMAGPVYHHNPDTVSEVGLPRYYDDTLFIYEWARNWIREVKLDDNGDIVTINDFMPDTGFIRPHDLELGPDGCLYLIEWGAGFDGGNRDARISRIEFYRSGERPPIAKARATPDSGSLPLTVSFTSEGSHSRAGGELRFEWDFDGDGAIESREPDPTFTYIDAGNNSARLEVIDSNDKRAVRHVPISAGNTEPKVSFEWPPDGGVFAFGDEIEFRVSVSDAEDQSIDTERVLVQPALGHDTHAHPLQLYPGLEGRFTTLRDDGHSADADLFTVITARYTDRGAKGVVPITARDSIILQPHRKQAEYATSAEGVIFEKSGDPESGSACAMLDQPGEHVSFAPINLVNIDSIMLRVGTSAQGGRLSLHLDDPDGAQLGEARIQPDDNGTLQAGLVPFRIEFFENSGQAGLIMRVQGPGIERQIVPQSMFARDTTGKPGINIACYELLALDELPDFDSLTPYRNDVVNQVNFASTNGDFATSGRAERVGAVLTGFLRIPENGAYTFSLESDDGSRLFIDNRLVVENDGLHAMREASEAPQWKTVTIPITDPGGTHELFIIHDGRPGSTVRINWIEFQGKGVSMDQPR